MPTTVRKTDFALAQNSCTCVFVAWDIWERIARRDWVSNWKVILTNLIKNTLAGGIAGVGLKPATANSLANPFCEISDCNGNGICIGRILQYSIKSKGVLGTKLAPVCLCNFGYTGLRCEIGKPCFLLTSFPSSAGIWILAEFGSNQISYCLLQHICTPWNFHENLNRAKLRTSPFCKQCK